VTRRRAQGLMMHPPFPMMKTISKVEAYRDFFMLVPFFSSYLFFSIATVYSLSFNNKMLIFLHDFIVEYVFLLAGFGL